jgi:hypothetical protein
VSLFGPVRLASRLAFFLTLRGSSLAGLLSGLTLRGGSLAGFLSGLALRGGSLAGLLSCLTGRFATFRGLPDYGLLPILAWPRCWRTTLFTPLCYHQFLALSGRRFGAQLTLRSGGLTTFLTTILALAYVVSLRIPHLIRVAAPCGPVTKLDWLLPADGLRAS